MLADFKAVANEQTQVKKDILKVLVASIVPLTLLRMFIMSDIEGDAKYFEFKGKRTPDPLAL
jgi:hypothetical protein